MSLAAETHAADPKATTFDYTLILGDTALILGQRVSEWTSNAPNLELDIALSNQALDLFGQARMLLKYAGEVEAAGRSEDDLAFLRDGSDFRNLLVAEIPNDDFGRTIARQFLFGTFAHDLYEALCGSADETIAAIASKGVKEMAYHRRHGGEWLVRLGDGTKESHARIQAGLDEVWPYCHELFMPVETEIRAAEFGIGVDPSVLKDGWQAAVAEIIAQAGLTMPEDDWAPDGGKSGQHTEHLGYILAEMQFLQRAYPGAKW